MHNGAIVCSAWYLGCSFVFASWVAGGRPGGHWEWATAVALPLIAQGEAGSGHGRRPLPCQCGSGAIAPVWVS
jgi:hypothetical protein